MTIREYSVLVTSEAPLGKRLFDICFSAFFLAALFPLYVLIALCIKLSSRGPMMYSSTRMGKEGRVFKCWKFRTMCVDAEEKLAELLKSDPVLEEEWKKFSKLKRDPRMTKIGRILRKTSLDELPQFWNVLKGDLSVVGPRPYLVEEIHNYVGRSREKILSVRPGITGIWQISGRNLLTFAERVKMEEGYAERQSFLFDILIIFKTIPIILFPKGAF